MKIFLEVKDKTIVSGGTSLRKLLSTLKDGKYKLSIEHDRKTRSLQQNALYWLWLKIMGDSLGYDPEELHTTFKAMFLTDRSKKIPLVRSTTKLDTVMFMQYMEKVAMKAAELGIELPISEEQYYS